MLMLLYVRQTSSQSWGVVGRDAEEQVLVVYKLFTNWVLLM